MNSITEFYNKMGPHYDEWMDKGESTLEDELHLVLKTFPRPCMILDVGCGTGRISLPLQNLGYHIVGVDISDGMIKIAKTKGLQEAYIADFANFRYQLGVFDGIISLHAGFSYINDFGIIMSMIQKCKNLLKADGRILWDTPNEKFFGNNRVLKWYAGDEIVEAICYGHAISILKRSFENEGFEIEDVWGSYSPLKKYKDCLPRIIMVAKKVKTELPDSKKQGVILSVVQ
jgi:SAM-dependent methyltransferase